ncbi:MAG: hypothetical protein NW241_07380 [Bacteroidia bacterium]|nr:hypothetical protein [Bacteroidia bacterium]
MTLSHWIFMLNPLLLIAGFAMLVMHQARTRPKPGSGPDAQDPGPPPGGDDGPDFDWDGPLDLPPGVYVLPPEPVAV